MLTASIPAGGAPLMRRVRLALAAACAAVFITAAPRAAADEFDWLYFPMFTHDTAHAVHLKALAFRPDGLLAAATRYPRTRDDWTGPESDAGWYNYQERLIDCETGFYVATSVSLLDQQGAKLATRPENRAGQIESLQSQLQVPKERWPDGSDIALACAGASNKHFQKKRAAAAARAQPLFSDISLIEVLTEDNKMLADSLTMRFDFSRIAKKPAAPASALFNDMRAQYLTWRKSTNLAYSPMAPDPASDAAALSEANRQLGQAGLDDLAISAIQGPLIEFTYSPKNSMLRAVSGHQRGDDVRETMRIDCENRIGVPIVQQAYRKGAPGPVVALKVKAVLPIIRERYENDPALEGDAADMCKIVAGIRYQAQTGIAPADDDTIPAGLHNGALAAHPTPEAMLLAIRASRRGAQ